MVAGDVVEIWEVKPNSDTSKKRGRAQLARYLAHYRRSKHCRTLREELEREGPLKGDIAVRAGKTIDQTHYVISYSKDEEIRVTVGQGEDTGLLLYSVQKREPDPAREAEPQQKPLEVPEVREIPIELPQPGKPAREDGAPDDPVPNLEPRPLTVGEKVFLAVALGLVAAVILAPAVATAVATVLATGGGASLLYLLQRIAPAGATG